MAGGYSGGLWYQDVRYLLDTHILLWSLTDPGRLGASVKKNIESSENSMYVSLVSLWELRIKEMLGKVTLPKSFYGGLEMIGFSLLAMNLEHIQALGDLPQHHRDPFDRMLLVQALCEQLTLITNDEQMRKYDASLLII